MQSTVRRGTLTNGTPLEVYENKKIGQQTNRQVKRPANVKYIHIDTFVCVYL